MTDQIARLQDPETIRLHMGELTASEMRVAQAAIRYALAGVEGERGGWIKCSDRLPEFAHGTPDHSMRIPCLVAIPQFEGLKTAYAEYRRNMYAKTEMGREARWVWLGKIMPWTPIYWMPLPQPPKENGDE